MKRILYSVFIALLMVNCSNGFLEEEDKSLITPEEFFLEDRDAQSAVDAIYSHFHGESVYANYYWLINALASDIGEDTGNNPDLAEFSDFALTPQNGIVANLWSELFSAINTTNFAIQNIPATSLSTVEKDELLAEARFFRGFFYFDLVRFFGAVPIDTTSNTNVKGDFAIGRSPIEEVYDLIETDLTYAFETLPNANGVGRPTARTALVFLAKLSMIKGEYNLATQINRLIFNAETYALLPDYGDVFKVANNNSQESVFSINFSATLSGPMNVATLPDEVGGRALAQPTSALIDSFDPMGSRGRTTLTDFSSSAHISKYWDQAAEPGGGRTANDLPLVRFADVLLMHAETINEGRGGPNSEANTAINAVRQRAGLTDIGRLSYDQFKDAILEERKRELAFEGHRWFDLVRMGKLAEKVAEAKPGLQITEKHFLLPIPQRELNSNPLLTQNPGY